MNNLKNRHPERLSFAHASYSFDFFLPLTPSFPLPLGAFCQYSPLRNKKPKNSLHNIKRNFADNE